MDQGAVIADGRALDVYSPTHSSSSRTSVRPTRPSIVPGFLRPLSTEGDRHVAEQFDAERTPQQQPSTMGATGHHRRPPARHRRAWCWRRGATTTTRRPPARLLGPALSTGAISFSQAKAQGRTDLTFPEGCDTSTGQVGDPDQLSRRVLRQPAGGNRSEHAKASPNDTHHRCRVHRSGPGRRARLHHRRDQQRGHR